MSHQMLNRSHHLQGALRGSQKRSQPLPRSADAGGARRTRAPLAIRAAAALTADERGQSGGSTTRRCGLATWWAFRAFRTCGQPPPQPPRRPVLPRPPLLDLLLDLPLDLAGRSTPMDRFMRPGGKRCPFVTGVVSEAPSWASSGSLGPGSPHGGHLRLSPNRCPAGSGDVKLRAQREKQVLSIVFVG